MRALERQGGRITHSLQMHLSPKWLKYLLWAIMPTKLNLVTLFFKSAKFGWMGHKAQKYCAKLTLAPPVIMTWRLRTSERQFSKLCQKGVRTEKTRCYELCDIPSISAVPKLSLKSIFGHEYASPHSQPHAPRSLAKRHCSLQNFFLATPLPVGLGVKIILRHQFIMNFRYLLCPVDLPYHCDCATATSQLPSLSCLPDSGCDAPTSVTWTKGCGIRRIPTL